MDETGKKSILEMARGAFLEQVDYEMSKVIDNIPDPNTKATGKRRMTVTISLSVWSDGATGEMCVVENVPQIPGQMALNGAEQEYPPQLKIIRTA